MAVGGGPTWRPPILATSSPGSGISCLAACREVWTHQLLTAFLDDFRVERSGIHIALFHGAERSWFAEQGAEKQPHAAFRRR